MVLPHFFFSSRCRCCSSSFCRCCRSSLRSSMVSEGGETANGVRFGFLAFFEFFLRCLSFASNLPLCSNLPLFFASNFLRSRVAILRMLTKMCLMCGNCFTILSICCFLMATVSSANCSRPNTAAMCSMLRVKKSTPTALGSKYTGGHGAYKCARCCSHVFL